MANPKLWGPPPTQQPNRYVAVTTVSQGGRVVDVDETRFGIRELRFDPDSGVYVNGEQVPLRGVNNHHDLGALGAAFNVRAARRQDGVQRHGLSWLLGRRSVSHLVWNANLQWLK